MRTRRSARSTRRRRRRRRAWSRSSPAPISTGVNGLPCGWLITGTDGKPMNEPPHPVLAQGKVRYVGDPVALVIAETPNQAKDAAELIEVDYDVLPAVVNCVDALKPGAPQIHDAAPGNKCYTWALGDKAAVDAAFAKAAHVTEARHRQQPADPERDRAARRGRVVQPRRRQLHALRRQPESARRASADDRVRARPARAQGARHRARRRRRLRLQDLSLCRRDGDGLGVEARQPPDQVGGRAQRELPLRRARPRPRDARRARARQGRQVPRDARAHDGDDGRVPVDVRVVHPDDPVRDAARRPVHDAGDLRRSDGVVHEHRAGRRLSRRRPARGDLRRRAPRAPGRGRARHRAGRDPPAQLHPHLPVPDAGRAASTTPATTTRRSTRR